MANSLNYGVAYPFNSSDSFSNTSASQSFTIQNSATLLTISATTSTTTIGLTCSSSLPVGSQVNVILTSTSGGVLTYGGAVLSPTASITNGKTYSQELYFNGNQFLPIGLIVQCN